VSFNLSVIFARVSCGDLLVHIGFTGINLFNFVKEIGLEDPWDVEIDEIIFSN
jgi:hypothetical protein